MSRCLMLLLSLAYGAVATPLTAPSLLTSAADPPMCHCPGAKAFGRNCSAACCAGGGLPCPALPSPNPWTCMTTVSVPGAVAVGAVYPNGAPAKFELNYTKSPGWVIHLSGGGWQFMKNTSSSSSELTVDGAPARGPPPAADICAPPSSSHGCYANCDGVMSDDATQNPLFQ